MDKNQGERDNISNEKKKRAQFDRVPHFSYASDKEKSLLRHLSETHE
jgi:hypothetical protein